MRKQRSENPATHFFCILLQDLFPISFFYYTQKKADHKRLHYHLSFEIGLCTEGAGTFFIEDSALSFQEGDISFIYPNQAHIAQSPNEFPSKWLFIEVDFDRLFSDDAHLLEKLWKCKEDIPQIIHPDDPNTVTLLKTIAQELDQQAEDYQWVVRQLLSAFVYKLLRLSGRGDNQLSVFSGASDAISPALSYIAQHYSDEISVQDLAKRCNLSETHFRVLFKKAVGRPPAQYLANIRVNVAKTLLKSTRYSVLSIAQNVGFDSISSFNRAFKAQSGQTPSAFRKQ